MPSRSSVPLTAFGAQGPFLYSTLAPIHVICILPIHTQEQLPTPPWLISLACLSLLDVYPSSPVPFGTMEPHLSLLMTPFTQSILSLSLRSFPVSLHIAFVSKQSPFSSSPSTYFCLQLYTQASCSNISL